MIKRAFDLAAATIGLILVSPLMAIIAVLVKRDSDGPVIFKQERVGLGGKAFTLLKFRTMTSSLQAPGPLVTAATDSRITKVGAVLRSTKLDELPQLVNVIRGEMSLVGPRPEVSRYVALWDPDQRALILSVRPGITDPASIKFSREQDILSRVPDPHTYYVDVILREKAALYEEYVLRRSLRLDARVLWATALRLLQR